MANSLLIISKWFGLVPLLVVVLTVWSSKADGVDIDCSHIAIDKRSAVLPCQTNCPIRADLVTWCFKNGVALLGEGTNHHTWSICLNGSGITNVYQEHNIPDDVRIDEVGITESGELFLPDVNYEDLGQAAFNCTVTGEDGRPCGVETFDLSVILAGPYLSPTIDTLSVSGVSASKLTIGRTDTLCLVGRYPEDNGEMRWDIYEDGGGGPERFVSLDISDNLTCYDCECASAALLQLEIVQQSISSESTRRFAAFSALYNHYGSAVIQECGEPNRFISILVISGVRPEDRGTYEFHYNLIGGNTISESVSLDTAYVTVPPAFSDLSSKVLVNESSNIYLTCSANTSYNATLQWQFYAEVIIPVPTIDSGELVDPLAITDPDSLSDFCSGRKGQQLSVTLTQALIPRASDNAAILWQTSALIFCSMKTEYAGTYVCMASDHLGILGTSIDVEVAAISGPEPEDDDTALIAGITAAVGGVLVLLVAVVCLLWACRYRSRSQAQRMIPMDVFPLTNPVFFDMLSPGVEEDPMEFPREQLRLIEVIGQGQFGQVWKAEAQGICPDQNRSIVAVKTLKPTARPSDVDDLYKELEMMKRMEPHPNILNFLRQCSETGLEPLYILMEYAIYGSLKSFLQSCRNASMSRDSSSIHSPINPSANPLLSSLDPHSPLHHRLHSNRSTVSPIPTNFLPIGGNEGLVSNGIHGLDAPVDPAIAAQAARLMRLLQSEYYYRSRYLDVAEANSSHEVALPYLKPVPTAGSETDANPAGKLTPGSPPSSKLTMPDEDLPSNYSFDKLATRSGVQPNYLFDHLTPSGGARAMPSCSSADKPLPQPNLTLNKPASSEKQSEPPVFSSSLTAGAEKSSLESSPAAQPDPADVVFPLHPPPGFNHVPLSSRGSCAYRPCLEDPYCYHPQWHSAQYNQERKMLKSEGGLEEENPISPAGSSIPTLSPTYTNVPDITVATYLHSLPDVYSQIKCHYCSSHPNDGDVASRPDVHAREQEPTRELVGQSVLTPSEVLDFSLQIARGMEHLEKMKCVHRDLAARNVLIAENFLLKIGDFGLSRDLSGKDYYRKITAGKLPARWMAIESLQERTHTYKSDVWSYGVVLWEIFTYGLTPYGKSPYANGIESLAIYLSEGHRLPQPETCSDDMYDLMQRCWNSDPSVRPSFTELISSLDNLLSEAHGYLKMDGPDSIPAQQQLRVTLAPPPSTGDNSRRTSATSSREILTASQPEAPGGQGGGDGDSHSGRLSAGASQSSLQQCVCSNRRPSRISASSLNAEPENQSKLDAAAISQSLHVPNGRTCNSLTSNPSEVTPSAIQSVLRPSSFAEGNNGGYFNNGVLTNGKPNPQSSKASPRATPPQHSASAERDTPRLLPVMHEVSRQEITSMGADPIPRSPFSKTLQFNIASRESQV